MPLIELTGVDKVFSGGSGEPVTALAGIDLSVEEHEFVTLVGRSGCGKSTLLRLIAGLLPTTRGEIRVHGERVARPRPDIGFVFQQPALLPWRRVLDNVLLPVEFLRRNRGTYEGRARELLSLVGLDGFEDRYPHELSGGMQQRAAICRSLVADPRILLMDEPFGALDALTREELALELQRIWQEHRQTIVFVTHSIQEAVLLGDRIVVLTPRPGQVAEQVRVDLPRPRALGGPDAAESLTRYGDHVRQLLFGLPPSDVRSFSP